MRRLELAARPPFNFLATVRSHAWRRLPLFSWDEERLGYVNRLSTGRVVKLALGGSDELTGVIVDIRANDALSDGEVGEIEGEVSWMLGLEEGLTDSTAYVKGSRPSGMWWRTGRGASCALSYGLLRCGEDCEGIISYATSAPSDGLRRFDREGL